MDDPSIDDELTLSTGAVSYAQAWESLLTDTSLSHGAVRFYLLLSTYARAHRKVVFPSQATIGNRLGVSVDTIQRWTNELHASHWIELKNRGQGRTQLCHINVPGGVQPSWVAQSRNRRIAASGNRRDAALASRAVAVSRTGEDAASLNEVDEEEEDVTTSISSLPSSESDSPDNPESSTPPPNPPPPPRNDRSYEQPDPEQFNRDIPMRRADSIGRFLTARGDVALGGAQEYARNIAKLSEMRPTANQLDAVCEAVKAGDVVQLGRLVSKFPTLRESAKTTKPEHWKTPKDRRQESQAKFVDAGGSQYDKDFIRDY